MVMNQQDIRDRLENPETRRQAAVEAGEWVKNLCLMFGTGIDTAFHVGGFFAAGLERSWSEEMVIEETTDSTPQ